MSLIYSVLKPILRITAVKKQAMTREDFIRQAEKVQKRQYKLSDIKDYEKQEQMICGCRCIIYSKQDSGHKKSDRLLRRRRIYPVSASECKEHSALHRPDRLRSVDTAVSPVSGTRYV